jgi:AraC-like DNA-binding protein
MPSCRLSVLTHPYRTLEPVIGGRAQLRDAARRPGSALIWHMGDRETLPAAQSARTRPGGLSLVVVLPSGDVLDARPEMIHRIHECRPCGLLPHGSAAKPGDIVQVLRTPSADLAADITEYLVWRGLVVDPRTIHLLRRIVELSAEARSITALSRGLYLSRRTLGRQLLTAGLPVPSHWLQLSRILRLSARLQNSEASVFSIACASGYPDGFSLSNQMKRLIGYRPSEVREFLGWEWILEAWLRKEADEGALAPSAGRVLGGKDPAPTSGPVAPLAKRPPLPARDRRARKAAAA